MHTILCLKKSQKYLNKPKTWCIDAPLETSNGVMYCKSCSMNSRGVRASGGGLKQ